MLFNVNCIILIKIPFPIQNWNIGSQHWNRGSQNWNRGIQNWNSGRNWNNKNQNWNNKNQNCNNKNKNWNNGIQKPIGPAETNEITPAYEMNCSTHSLHLKFRNLIRNLV